MKTLRHLSNSRTLIRLLSLILLTAVCIQLNAQKQPLFWYEDNNMNTAGGFPPDFTKMFTDPGQWENLRDTLSIYLVRGNTLGRVIDQEGTSFISDYFAPVLVESGLPLAIDNPPSLAAWPDFYRLLTDNGLELSHVGLQSTLSKPRNGVTPQFDPELEKRIQEVKSKITGYRETSPETKFGIIDARPTKGWEYKSAYRRTKKALESVGDSLDFILLDCPYSYVRKGSNISFQKLKEVEAYVMNDLGLEYGLIITDNTGGMTSDAAFHESVMSYAEGYDKGGSVPDHIILMSWFLHPAKALPENAPEGVYPMTKVGLELFRYLGSHYATNVSIMNSPAPEPVAKVWTRENELVTNWNKALSRVQVFDIMGRKIKEFRGDAGSMYIADLGPGIYIVSLQSENESFTTRIRVH